MTEENSKILEDIKNLLTKQLELVNLLLKSDEDKSSFYNPYKKENTDIA